MFRLQPPLPDDFTTATSDELVTRVTTARSRLGKRLVILGHHYQREEVIQFADKRGDSLGLSRFAADQHDAEFVVFCGVHFMAESADILTGPRQKVILPDLNAGCSMADMANLDDVAQIWNELGEVTDLKAIVPITYVNSAAVLKAFVGRNSGAVCTSTNARAVLTWALDRDAHGRKDGPAGASGLWAESRGAQDRSNKVLFFPDQHLGRNTGFQLGYGPSDMQVVDPRRRLGGLADTDVKEATFLLWKGHCSVHQRFRTEHVEAFRSRHPDGIVIVHPECSHEVVELADEVGSTDYIIGAVSTSACRLDDRGRHGDPSRRPARPREPRPDGALARPARLPVLDDVPDRPSTPRVGARRPRRRGSSQPHHGGRENCRGCPGCPRKDARDRLRYCLVGLILSP